MYDWWDLESMSRMQTGWKVARIRGVDVRLRPGAVGLMVTFATLIRLGWASSGGLEQHPLWVAMLLGVLVYSVLALPEVARMTMARSRGLEPIAMVLGFTGARASLHDHTRPRPATEGLMGLTSAVMSALVLMGAYGLWRLAGEGPVADAAFWLLAAACLSCTLACVPSPPFALGRVVHALLWSITGRRALSLRLAVAIGRGVLAIAFLVPAYILMFEDATFPGGLVLALFLLNLYVWAVSGVPIVVTEFEELLAPGAARAVTLPLARVDLDANVSATLAELDARRVAYALLDGPHGHRIVSRKEVQRAALAKPDLQLHDVASIDVGAHQVTVDFAGHELVALARCRKQAAYLVRGLDGEPEGVALHDDLDAVFRQAWLTLDG